MSESERKNTGGWVLVNYPFSDPSQQREAALGGMWVFLATEALFFGGLFLSYFVYRSFYPDAFARFGRQTDVLLGTVNTAVLLTSSYAVAQGVGLVQGNGGKARRGAVWLGASALLGTLFLFIKASEWHRDFQRGWFPGPGFGYSGPQSVEGELFFRLYFLMTGLHGLHVLIGVAVLLVLAWRLARAGEGSHLANAVEAGGLYWHFVDLIWVFLFPLFYLIERGG